MRSIIFILIFFGLLVQTDGQISIDISAGLAGQTYNKVQIPNEEGTAFDLYKNFEIQTPVINYILKLGYCFREKNHLFLLYAPLSVNYEGAAPFAIRFQNATFLEGQKVNARYIYNSYRVTYRRDLYSSEKWIVGVGITAKIRDAEIRLKDSNTSYKKDDFGLVPLWNLYAEYNINNWSLFFDGDGMASGPGRVFDLYLGGKIPINEHLKVKAAYRMVESGSDVRSIYNFTMLHFANLGFIINI